MFRTKRVISGNLVRKNRTEGSERGAVRKLTVPTSHNKKIKYKIGNKLLNEIYKKLSIEPIKWKYLIYEKKN